MPTSAAPHEINAILNAIEIGVYGVDSAGRCTFVNKAALDMLGYTNEDLLGSNMHEIIHHTYPDGTPYPQSACPLLQTLETGRAVQLDNEMLWRKDGSFFNAEYSSFPVFDDAAVTGSVITFQDTAHKGQARKRLGVQISVSRILAGSSELDTALTQVLGAIGAALGWHVGLFWEVDEKAGVLRNAVAWPGPDGVGEEFLVATQSVTFERGAGLPGRVWETDTPEYLTHLASDTNFARREAAVEAGLRSGFAFPLKTGTRTVGIMEFFSRRWQQFDEDFLDSIATLGQQIGQFLRRKRAEEDLRAAKEEAEEANHAKSQFIANMSHELRTPLTAVIGYGEMLAEEAEDRGLDSMLDDLRKINSNARHLLSLINDVLDISKIEAGRTEVHLEKFDVCPLITELASTTEALVAKNENRLVVNCATGVGEMYSDPVKVRQCVINLVSNAAKFTEKGTVTLDVERRRNPEGDSIVIRVIDTGIGMTEQQVGKLFRRFMQADSSTTRRFGGTGLGLSITRAFASLLGGDVGVESAPGKGTVFTLRLPSEAVCPTHPEAPTPLEASSSLQDISAAVLVIDDDPNARALLSRFLIREGFAVRTASDGESGLKLARALKPRAILLDVMMPHMDGWAVLSALKSDPEVADIPVIMETIVQEKGLAFSLGAEDYLTKPIQWPRLKKLLDRFRSEGPQACALIVDDDNSTFSFISGQLEKEGWSISQARDRDAAFELLEKKRPALILVDLNTSQINAFALIQELRRLPDWRDVPVVALSATELSADERRRLEGHVQQIINTEHDASEALRSVLRKIPPAHANTPDAAPEKR
ncbi:MAG TPA: response regulator [Burkholderiales bacterium]|nr:response regulator [Burkholderiales bacterium]